MGRLKCVVYRVGGIERFEWRRTLAMFEQDAEVCKVQVTRQGYKAYVVDYFQSLAIGVPDTWS
jgi:hypothetical protein